MTGWWRSRQALRNALAVAPLFALLAVFFFAPLLSTLWNSFFGWSFDFGKYLAVISEPVNFRILANTLKVGVLVTATALAVAYPLAYQMTKVGPRMFALVSALVLIPLFTAFLIRTYAWIVILGRQGIVNNALIWLGLIDQPLTILNTTVAVVIGMTHVFVPMAVFTIYSGMVRIDRSMLRAASALGAHPVQAFTRVYLPLTLPSVLSAGVLIFVVAIGFYITPSLLGGPGDTMISQLVVVQMNTMLDFEMGYALSIVLLVITLAILLLAGLVIPLETIWSTGLRSDQASPERIDPARLRQVLLAPLSPVLSAVEDGGYRLFRLFARVPVSWLGVYAGAALVFLVAPLLVIVILSFSASPFVVFPPPGFSLQWWEKLYAAHDWHSAFLASVKLGVTAALCATLIGTMGAFWLVRTSLKIKRMLFLFALAPLIVPVIVIATSLYVFEARLRILGSFTGLVIGHTLLATPYVLIVMSSAIRNFDRTLERAAAIHGATPLQTLKMVTLPLLFPALVTAALMAFLASFDELLVTIFLIGRQTPTLPLKFWGDIKYQIDPMLSTASTLIVLMVVVAILATQYFHFRQARIRAGR
ncbi:ABC transporter permease subunit [Dongia sedimenti]|uniref:ABC transporter permease subunit n=1 Tax=Dongia sedimenti TaxID=3064282 RepID=A0ABU0YVJ7_9PROT|nr:ABC transporter permease subunit [Rhodospirillaceae bacterium R-7]